MFKIVVGAHTTPNVSILGDTPTLVCIIMLRVARVSVFRVSFPAASYNQRLIPVLSRAPVSLDKTLADNIVTISCPQFSGV